MAFQLRIHEDQTTGLVAVCDICGRLALSDDHLVWRPPSDCSEKPGDLFDFRVVCKGACDRMLEREGHHYWQEIGPSLVYLLNNTKTNLKKAARTAAVLNRL